MNILIIGQSGFLGSSIIKYGSSIRPHIEFPKFSRDQFLNKLELDKHINNCDVVILLSAICRGLVDDEIYNINMSYVNILIESLERVKKNCTIVFPSSSQEEDSTGYGRSKRDGRIKLAEWSSKNNNCFLGLILPNIFGPNAKVNYASFIATFSSIIHSGNTPTILTDNSIKLLYVQQFVDSLMYLLINEINSDRFVMNEAYRYKVSEVLKKLYFFKECADKNQKILYTSFFDIYLHETFLSYEGK